jgi:uncharacterized protein (TIGR02453 family)
MATINKSTLDFLKELKMNNNREWFLNNQATYKAAKGNFEAFVQEVIKGVCEFDPILKGLEAKNCIFRINRDVRFTNDKSPYKTNFGAFIVRGGKKNGDRYAGYYIHIDPEGSFIAGGAYMPPSPWLSAIREKIDEQHEKFKKIINDKNFIKHFKELEGEKLKKPPKGYSSDNPNIELLKHKSYLVMSYVSDNQLTSPDYYNHVLDVMKAMKPLHDFLNDW